MTPLPIKRRGLLGLIGALPIFGRCADPGPPSFELVPALHTGQQWRFEFERKATRDGAVLHWYRAPLHVRVLEATADGALLEWVEGAQTIVDAHPQRRPLLEIGLAAMREVPLQLRVDATGRVLALANAAEVRALCLRLMGTAAAQWRARPGMAEMVDAMQPALEAVYASDAMVASATLREPLILLGAMGRRFGADEPVEFRTTLANPFGGLPLDAIARFAIRQVQARARKAELGWLMVSDPVATRELARTSADTAVHIAKSAGADPGAPAMPAITLEERGDYVIDTDTAWPTRVTHARTVRAGPMAQVDATSFSLA